MCGIIKAWSEGTVMWKEILPPDVQALGAGLAERAAREREAGHTIYPPQEQIFRALELTPPEKVKVCLVGQDPYHEAGQANGHGTGGCRKQP